MIAIADPSTYTIDQLNRELDRVKAGVFMAEDAVFFGSLMCSLEFTWDTSIQTAATNGIKMWWNPGFFKALDSTTRLTVLKHELWHVARLHMIRAQNRNHEIWNYACDLRINNDLENSKNTFTGVENCWKDHSYDKAAKRLLSEEELYDLLYQDPPPGMTGSGSFGEGGGGGDMVPLTDSEKQSVVNTVVQAVQQAKLSGAPGTAAGHAEEVLKKFLDPVVPWEQLLMQFFTDMLDDDYTWRRPNRRYEHIYLPSRFTDDGRLRHLVYFIDVSGSIDDNQILRMNSEVKYIQETLQPEKLTLVQFDTKIQAVNEFAAGDPFDEIKIIGRGGTCLRCVRKFIEDMKPTAAVVFSDMHVPPMESLSVDVPIIWAVYDNPGAKVPFGKIIHVK